MIKTIQYWNYRKLCRLAYMLLASLSFSCITLDAQTPASPSVVSDPAQANKTPDSSGVSADRSVNSYQNARPEENTNTLSAGQIFSVLRQQPDAVVDLKSLLADVAQQQGLSIQPESITDEDLFARIQTSRELRTSITTFLRARGYLNDSDLTSDIPDSEMDDESGAEASGNSFSWQDDQRSAALLRSLPSHAGTRDQFGRASNSRAMELNRDDASPIRDGLYGKRSRLGAEARSGTENNSTSMPKVLHQPAPYNLLSLRDLYTQLPEQSVPLKRFGSEFFTSRLGLGNRTTPFDGSDPSLDVPAGPDYIVGPGDSLSIELWGGISQSFTRTIDREGRIALPESGSIQVAGLAVKQVKDLIAHSLQQQYRDVQVAVAISRLRTIRIYVVGDVQRPGAYEISSLSTSLNALFAAGGPTGVGSLRILKHYRGSQLIGEIDLYDFLIHGVQTEDRLLAGDSLLVPPAGPQVAVYGSVKRPSIYELKGAESLPAVLDEAGGATVAAELGHIVVDRIDANQKRETVSLDLPTGSDPGTARKAMIEFSVHDGDRICVSSIAPYSQRIVYLSGHVIRPGRMPYHDGMELKDVIHSYQDLLPEPADRGDIVRLMAPDLHPETIEFSVPDALIGNVKFTLQPYDTVRIYGRYEADAPKVAVGGEVLRPGMYSLSAGMTASQLVRMAGGFKRDALLENADLTSYSILDGRKVVSERTAVRIGDAVVRANREADVALKPGDVLTIHQISGWNDIGSSIVIEGEVANPGTYGIQQGERLSSILKRAGGLRSTSYPAGAVLLREDVRKLEEKSREELIRQIETSSVAARMGSNLASTDQTATLQLIAQQQEQVLTRLKSQPATGRLVIHMSADIAAWENTPDDIEVRTGDILRVPKRPGFVLVSGQVYNSSAITFTPDKTAGWYLRHAGGATEVANTRDIFIIRANGSVVGRESKVWFQHDVLATQLEPGDVLVVPQKIIGASLFWRNLLTVAQVTSSIAITAAVAGLL